MIPAAVLNALLYAAECLIGGALILAAAAVLARRWRGHASARHFVWLVAFGGLAALPLLAAILPAQIVIREAVAAPPPALAATAARPVLPPATAPVVGANVLAESLLAVWLAGAAWVGFGGAVGALEAARLYRRSVPYFLETVDAGKLGAEGLRWQLRLATVPGGAGPLTFGFRRPVVLLPKAAVLWPPARLQAALLHELAHVRRHDCLIQALALAVCAVYWPNPLVWFGARALRREAEIAADDAVLRSGVRPSAYADQLVALAAECRGHASGLVFSMAGRPALEMRVRSILAPSQSRSGVNAMNALKIVALGLLTTSALALARPAIAEEQAPPPPPAVAPGPSVAPAAPDASVAPAPGPDAVPAASREVAPAAPPAEPADASPPAVPAVPAVPPLPAMAPLPPLPPQLADPQQRRAVEQARKQLEASMARMHRQIEQAMVQAGVAQQAARQAMDKARPDIERAMVQARQAQEQARAALARVQPEIDRALAEAHRHRVHVEVHVDGDGNGEAGSGEPDGE